jgi:PEP-CTERM motif
MKRFASGIVIAAVVGFFSVSGPPANASEVVIGISGALGDYSWDSGTPVSDGSFFGSVTFASLPTANSSVATGTADINFYNVSDNLVFTIKYGIYATLTANATDYASLDVSGYSAAGNSGYHIDGLDLNFSSWPIGGSQGTVNLGESSLEFQDPSGKTWFNPLLTAQTSVPEPSSMLLGLVGMAGCAFYVRSARRNATA